MPTFDYVALKVGQADQIKGRIDADTERDARRKIRQKGETAVSIKEVKAGGGGKALQGLFQPNHNKSVLVFTTQLQYLIRSGITLTDALKVLADQSESKDFSNIIKILYSSVVEKGMSFADSLKEFRCFSHLYVSMVNAGESTGTLPDVLLRLAGYAKKKEEVENKVRSALTYPVIMLVVGLGVVIFLLSYLVPKITPILTKKGEALPRATEILLTISDVATSKGFWMSFIPAVIGIIFLYKMIRATKKGRLFFDGFFLKIPLFGDLNRKAAVSRFCVTLSSLLKSGVKIEKAMKIVEEVVGNAVVAETVQIIAERIREGESIAGPLERSNLFPKVVTYMISVGEKAGSEELQEMLDSIADSYDMEIEQSATRLTDLLTPILLLFMAGLVVFILLAVLLPIMNLSSVK